jgi:sarcosine oxidase subunit gamma
VSESFHPTRYSPLAGLPPAPAGIALNERAYIGKVNLRGDKSDLEFASAIRAALDVDLPVAPNTVASNDNYTVYWLGPDEWMLHCAQNGQSDIVSRLQELLRSRHAAVTDVSDYYVVIRMSGEKAREVLSKGTPFDVHPRAFKPGACAQTCFGHASILLHCLDDAPTFDIQVRWSFAEYIWRYLVDGAGEY